MAEGSQSTQGLIPTIIITLLAAYGITGTISNSTSAPSTGNSLHAANASLSPNGNLDKKYPHSAAALLEDFLATKPVETDTDRPWLQKVTPPDQLSDDRKKYRVKFLIATLPGPASPTLRSDFDNDLDGIVSAAYDDGYTIDNFDLPWQESDGSTNDSAGFQFPSEIDLSSPLLPSATLFALKSKEEPSRWRTQPGLILFRPARDDSSKPLLRLFLVGEIETRGINKPVMHDALEQISWLWGLQRRPPANSQVPASEATPPAYLRTLARPDTKRPSLDIIGPSFSGSADSMHIALQSWRSEYSSSHDQAFLPSINYLVGSATGLAEADLCGGIDACQFSSFIMPDANRWSIIIPDLQDGITSALPLPPAYTDSLTFSASPRIGLLAEESTYGGGGEDPVLAIADHNNHSCSSTTDNRDSGLQPSCLTRARLNDINDPFIVMPFPPQISSLRTALESQQPNRPPTGPEFRSPDVPESSEGNEKSADVLPVFSTRSRSSDQLMLNESLITISKAHVPYVGITASDVSDLIFLAESVHDNSPDAMLFTLSSDLRVLRQAATPSLYGMLMFSTYPLFPGNEQWDKSQSKHLLREFTSEDAEGIYNATRSAISDLLHPEDKGLERNQRRYLKAAAIQSHLLWVSAVGRDQLWPLAFQTSGADSSFDHRFLPHAWADNPPLLTILILTLLLLTCGLMGLLCLTSPQAQRRLRIPASLTRLAATIHGPPFFLCDIKAQLPVVTFSIGLLVALIIGGTYFCNYALHRSHHLISTNDWLAASFWISLPALILFCSVLLIAAIAIRLYRLRHLHLWTTWPFFLCRFLSSSLSSLSAISSCLIQITSL